MTQDELVDVINGRQLVLHFDVRNTILVADSVSNVDVAGCLNSYLTSVAWGIVDDGIWRCIDSSGRITAPQRNAISYYKYAESKLSRNNCKRYLFRKTLGHFTDTADGESLRPLFEAALAKLRWTHEPHEYLSMLSADDKHSYHYLLPSFLHLLFVLDQCHVDYRLILRTYGLDAPNVLHALKLVANGAHPNFSSIDFNVVEHSCRLVRSGAHFALYTDPSSEPITNEALIHGYFLSLTTHSVTAVIDDFHAWMNDDYRSRSGKPLWIEPHRRDVVQVFFDDNIRLDQEDSIVDLRLINDNNTVVPCNDQHIQRAALRQVDLLAAIHDEAYFVRSLIDSLSATRT